MIWKQLEGYSRYKISDTGLVKNLATKRYIKGSISQKYICVTLYPDKGKQKSQRLHRIIATLFCPNEKNYRVVNHKDGDKLNNTATNLEWTTARKNTQHAAKLGKLTTSNHQPIRRRCIKTGEEKEYDSVTDAYADNTDCLKHLTYIINACSDRQKTSGGYEWEYINENIQDTSVPENGKEISGFEKYLITPGGKVYSKKTKRFLKPSKNNAGYLVVDLHGDKYDDDKDHTLYTRKRASKRKKFRVHRLVAEYFITNQHPEIYLEVNHKNKNRIDNRVENLEWVSSEQNLQHAHNKAVNQFTKDGCLVQAYHSLNDASIKTGIGMRNISSCVRKGWKYTAGGFHWCYATEKGYRRVVRSDRTVVMVPLNPPNIVIEESPVKSYEELLSQFTNGFEDEREEIEKRDNRPEGETAPLASHLVIVSA